MPAHVLAHWQAYFAVEPTAEEVADAGQANIVAAVLSAAPRDKPLRLDWESLLVRPKPKRKAAKHSIENDLAGLIAWAKSTKKRRG